MPQRILRSTCARCASSSSAFQRSVGQKVFPCIWSHDENTRWTINNHTAVTSVIIHFVLVKHKMYPFNVCKTKLKSHLSLFSIRKLSPARQLLGLWLIQMRVFSRFHQMTLRACFYPSEAAQACTLLLEKGPQGCPSVSRTKLITRNHRVDISDWRLQDCGAETLTSSCDFGH